MKTNTIIWCAALAATSLCPGLAGGQTIDTTFNNVAPSLIIKGRFVSGATYKSYNSGVMNFKDVTFDAFCVDPWQTISSNQALTYQIQDISTLKNAAIISRLVGGFLASTQSASEAAAVQWAIWEVLAETSSSFTLSSGDVKIDSVNSATRDLANTYLANQASFTGVQLTYLTNSKSQDMVTWQVVPEPTSAALCALSSIFLLRRRRK
ncbi:MAG: PEP-CTERM sorting domain-containing protein [Luteolibacter sp.]